MCPVPSDPLWSFLHGGRERSPGTVKGFLAFLLGLPLPRLSPQSLSPVDHLLGLTARQKFSTPFFQEGPLLHLQLFIGNAELHGGPHVGIVVGDFSFLTAARFQQRLPEQPPAENKEVS